MEPGWGQKSQVLRMDRVLQGDWLDMAFRGAQARPQLGDTGCLSKGLEDLTF